MAQKQLRLPGFLSWTDESIFLDPRDLRNLPTNVLYYFFYLFNSVLFTSYCIMQIRERFTHENLIFFQSICLSDLNSRRFIQILHARSLLRVKQKRYIENKSMLFTQYTG